MSDTAECIASIARIDYSNLRLVMVNNGSRDFDEAILRQQFPSLTVVSTGDNLGFTGGNNRGIQRALEDGADFVLLLNNDTVVTSELITSLLPLTHDPQVGVVGPAINYYDEPARVWFAGGFFNRLVGYSYRLRPLAPFAGARRVDWINGCAVLIKRQVFEAIGDLWEPFFLNCEDLEFCLRAGSAGYACVQLGKPLVYHKVSASGGVRGTDQLSPDKAYYIARNHLLLIRLRLRGVQFLAASVSQFFIIMPFWFIQSIRHGQLAVMGDYVRGLWDGLMARSGKRKAIPPHTVKMEAVPEAYR